MKYGFGIDLGGTTCKYGLFEDSGRLLEKWELPTNRAENGAYIIEDIAKSVQLKIREKALRAEDVIGVGLGVPGPVTQDGIVKSCANLGWQEMKIEQLLSEKLGLTVKAANDANVAAMGELWQGSGKGCRNLVMVTLGTGVGGGIVQNGVILAGTVGAGGEIGHMCVNPKETVRCSCGSRGCLEQYVSATGIVRRAKELLEQNGELSRMREYPSLTAKNVIDAAKAGDKTAIAVMEEFGDILGQALANLSVIVNPELFLIGGGVSKAGQFLLDYVRAGYRKNVFFGCKDTRIELASLGNDAGIYGSMGMLC